MCLAVDDIDHSRTQGRSAWTNAICVRFRKTILNEFQQAAFRNGFTRLWRICRRILTRGSTRTTMNASTSGACADFGGALNVWLSPGIV
jgi:hypothetical protein